MLKFDYTLERHGWGRMKISWSDRSVEFDASYINDPIEELASQARWIVDPVFRSLVDFPARTVFLDEPGEVSLELAWETPVENPRDRSINLTSRSLILTLIGDDGIELQEQFRIDSGEFASAVFEMLSTMWEKHGVIQYRDRWSRYDFPLAHFAAIGRMLERDLPKRGLWIV
jgi:hypothetical protein